jgi:hypothetical protein
MNCKRNFLSGILVLALASIGLLPQLQTAPPPTPVEVVAPVPLPVDIASPLPVPVSVEASIPLPVEVSSPLPLPVKKQTHLGRPAADFVILRIGELGSGPAGRIFIETWIRAFPNGDQEFFTTVPQGKVLVLTDIECHAIGEGANYLNFDLTNPGGTNPRYFLNIMKLGSGEVEVKRSMTSGIVFGPGTKVQANWFPSESTGNIQQVNTFLYGYLADAPRALAIRVTSSIDGAITVAVTQEDEALAGAKVTIFGDPGTGRRVVLTSGVTDEQGQFVIRQSLPATFLVTVEAPDGETLSQRVTLNQRTAASRPR